MKLAARVVNGPDAVDGKLESAVNAGVDKLATKNVLAKLSQKKRLSKWSEALVRVAERKIRCIDKKILEYEGYQQFTYIQRNLFIKENKKDLIYFKDFLTPAEKLRVVLNIIQKIEIRDTISFTKISRLVSPNPEKRTMMLHYFLEQSGLMKKLVPLHDSTTRPAGRSLFIMSNNEIRTYFGENISIYFYYMSHYIKFLSIAAVIGGLAWYFDYADSGFHTNSSPYNSMYGLAIIVWANLMYIFWKRKENAMRVEFQLPEKG